MDLTAWITPVMVLASTLWIVCEVRSLGERLAHLAGCIVRWQNRTAGRPDR